MKRPRCLSKRRIDRSTEAVVSVISKCEKAKVKFGEETNHQRCLENLIKAMNISKGLIEDQLDLME